ncbi:uncharacterized protein LOC132619780 [Lycium barbarum]|uniref:uncharacterized protein LOC132619780 n=1 Tax=Lycium barbarum TaxID=112863 RepID=UPI00293EDD0A|nr:uncharacterized protein LOC132619780 [Lycium barbarum]
MVADALSRKAASMCRLARSVASERPLAIEVQNLANNFVRFDVSNLGRVLACVEARGEAKEAMLDSEGLLKIKGCVRVPRVGGLIRLILEEAHNSRYSIYPGEMKMYRDLRQHLWWGRMKRDIADSVLCMRIISKSSVSTSNLLRYHSDGSYIVLWDSVLLDENLSYEEEPIVILDIEVQKLRTKEIASVKVQWKHRLVEEATWEPESDMRSRYPQLFTE